MSSFGALLLATPISVAIALFLTELAPRSSRTAIGTLVELLAGIPSVILGLWGIIVLGPVLNDTIEPALHSVLGWIPIFGGTYSLVGLFPAMLILTIMTVPIVSSLTREIFATVPPDRQGGRSRARRDPLGDDQDGRAALLAAGDHRRGHPRPGPGGR